MSDTQDFRGYVRPPPTPALTPDSDDEGAAPVPGYRNYRLYCDESGIHGARFVGFGALIMPDQRRGDFPAFVNALRRKHGFNGEIKWTKVSARNVEFCEDLVRGFFSRRWLLFHCIVIERSFVDMSLHNRDRDLALRKHFGLFLQKRIKFLNAQARDKRYHVIVDPLPSRYKKADEAAAKIANHTLRRDIGSELITTLVTRDSRATLGIQVADILLGAILAGWQGEVTSGPKLRLTQFVADHLGWQDTFSDTYPTEAKVNIWHFDTPGKSKRRVRTRGVKLRIPCPIYISRR